MLFRRKARRIRRLLLVEDEPLIAFDNEHALVSAGYTIASTVDRAEVAMPLLDDDTLDALVTDINLAGPLKGSDIARVAHERGLAVLLVTGDCPADAADFAHACLLKPYRPAELVEALRVVETMMFEGRLPRSASRLTLYAPR